MLIRTLGGGGGGGNLIRTVGWRGGGRGSLSQAVGRIGQNCMGVQVAYSLK